MFNTLIYSNRVEKYFLQSNLVHLWVTRKNSFLLFKSMNSNAVHSEAPSAALRGLTIKCQEVHPPVKCVSVTSLLSKMLMLPWEQFDASDGYRESFSSSKWMDDWLDWVALIMRLDSSRHMHILQAWTRTTILSEHEILYRYPTLVLTTRQY